MKIVELTHSELTFEGEPRFSRLRISRMDTLSRGKLDCIIKLDCLSDSGAIICSSNPNKTLGEITGCHNLLHVELCNLHDRTHGFLKRKEEFLAEVGGYRHGFELVCRAPAVDFNVVAVDVSFWSCKIGDEMWDYSNPIRFCFLVMADELAKSLAELMKYGDVTGK